MKVFEIKKIYKNNVEIFNNVMLTFLIKGLGIIISLFMMPLYIMYFNNQQVLGLWFTILSVLSWILIFDIGIGNGLRNHLVRALVNKNNDEAKKYISSAYVTISIIVLIVILTSLFLFSFINWNKFFNINESIVPKSVLNTTIIIVYIGIMVHFVLKLITSVLYAMQKSALINFMSLLTSVVLLVYVINIKLYSISESLISLAIVYIIAINSPLLIATFIIFSSYLKNSRPNINYFDLKSAKDVIKLGGAFFWVQIMYMIITTTNEILITRLCGSAMVVEYQIYNKVFTLIGMIFTLALIPIWSAVTKALEERRYLWIKKLYKVLIIMAIIASVFEFIMIFFLQYCINLWLGENSIEVNYFYSLVFAMSGSIFIWNGVLSSIANGFGELKLQIIFFTIGAIIKIPLSFVLVSKLDSWIGVVIASIISLSLYCFIQPIWLNIYLKKKVQEEKQVSNKTLLNPGWN